MKPLSFITLLFSALAVSHAAVVPDADAELVSRGKGPSELEGYDVGYYDKPDWQGFANNGTKFSYILASDSTANPNMNFFKNFNRARKVGLIVGAVHSASPYSSNATEQVKYFLSNGGRWKRDGKTLPGALSIAFAPSRASCWGFTPDQLKAWIWEFSNAYYKAVGRRPVIRTNTNFWTTCMNNPSEFASKHKLWLVTYQSSTPGPLPAGWSKYTFWQYKDLGLSGGSYGTPLGYLDKFNGNKGDLHSFAVGK